MGINHDFSFIRFLKVVKTLYESSIFTQLGNTVGQALNNKPLGNRLNDFDSIDEEDEDDSSLLNDETMETADENTLTAEAPKISLLSALTACTSPTQDNKTDGAKQGQTSNGGTNGTLRKSNSLFDQVMNSCGVGHEEDEWDDDIYHSDGANPPMDTFDSLTDDELHSYKERARKQGLV